MIWPATTGSGRSFGTARSSSPAPAPVAICLAASFTSSRSSVVTLEASRYSTSGRGTDRRTARSGTPTASLMPCNWSWLETK